MTLPVIDLVNALPIELTDPEIYKAAAEWDAEMARKYGEEE